MWYISFHCVNYVHSCVFFGSHFATRYEQIETEIQDRPLILEVNRFSSLYWQSEQTGQIFKGTHFYYSAIWDRWYPQHWSKHRQVLCHSCFGCPPVLKHFLKRIKHGTIWDLISSFSKNDAWLISAPEFSIKHSDQYVCSYLPMPDWVISQCSQWAWQG